MTTLPHQELPILFNTEMVRAILDGRKTQTRRPVKHSYMLVGDDAGYPEYGFVDTHGNEIVDILSKSPFGKPGDRLYVRETFAELPDRFIYRASWALSEQHSWTPSIHMPKDAARIWLEVVDVRVERLHEITEEGAKAEGVTPVEDAGRLGHYVAFNSLWWDIYDNWDANPWVWVCEFKRVEKPNK